MKFILDLQNNPLYAFDDNHVFTQKELDTLNIVSYTCNEQEQEYILRYCQWRNGTFYLKLADITLDTIKSRIALIQRDNFVKQPRTDELFYRETHLAICAIKVLSVVRRDYINRTLTLIQLNGFDQVLSAMRYGCYSDIREALRVLPLASKVAIKNSLAFTQELKDLLRDTWGVIS